MPDDEGSSLGSAHETHRGNIDPYNRKPSGFLARIELLEFLFYLQSEATSSYDVSFYAYFGHLIRAGGLQRLLLDGKVG